MSSAKRDTSHHIVPKFSRVEWPEPNAATHYRNDISDHQFQVSSFESDAIKPGTQQSRPIQASDDSKPASTGSSTDPRRLQGSTRSTVTTSSSRYLELNSARQARSLSYAWTSGETVTSSNTRASPISEGDIPEIENDDRPEPASKRYKLSDDGWIEQALRRGQEERGGPDPSPMPQLTQSGHVWESPAHSQAKTSTSQPRLQPSAHWLSPPGLGRSPPIRSATLSRRPSSAYSTSSPSHSPALTQRSNTSASRRGPPSPTDGSVMGGFSDLEIISRANSRAPDGVDCDATFSRVHGIPQVELPPRRTAGLSTLEQLPKQIFMRIMMYCGYKAQVLLKRCNYNLYIAVDLEAIPWEERTSTILFEERDNPKNFPRKSSKPQKDEEDGPNDDEAFDQSKRAIKRKKAAREAGSSSPRGSGTSPKSKAHIDAYGNWGCYCCYKLLPAYYFEGALLEDKEGRTPKSNKLRGADTTESDKKVDMRVEYVQILGAVRGPQLPKWLAQEKKKIHATDIKSYVMENMEGGVDCDDLRAYYKHIARDTHLVAPIRGITPVFTPSSISISSNKVDSIAKTPRYGAKYSPRTIQTPLPAMPLRQEESPITQDGVEASRPLYKLQTGNATHIEADSASYTYQILIPGNAERSTRAILLPQTKPVSRICLPQTGAPTQETVLEIGDVVSLRRVCIPCGTKFAVYRRDCNRKIISKTDEQWWVCDCPEVRLAGRSTGCPTCGRKVIY